jgi:hypothetical protein
MRTIVTHPHGALSQLSSLEARKAQLGDRAARLAALDPEQLPLALSFLIDYLSSALDAVLEAVEPDLRETAPGMEPFCARCGAQLGVFLAHGPEYRHFRGIVTATSKPRPYKADHAPEVGWRPVTDIPARAG